MYVLLHTYIIVSLTNFFTPLPLTSKYLILIKTLFILFMLSFVSYLVVSAIVGRSVRQSLQTLGKNDFEEENKLL